MILGCLLLVLILNRYGFSTKVSALIPSSVTTAKALAVHGNDAPAKFFY